MKSQVIKKHRLFNSFVLSTFLHILLIFILGFQFNNNIITPIKTNKIKENINKETKKEIVSANLVDTKQIEQAVSRQKKAEKERKNKLQAEENKLKKLKADSLKLQQQEKQRLAILKAEKDKLLKLEQAKFDKMKKEKKEMLDKEQAKLDKIKKETKEMLAQNKKIEQEKEQAKLLKQQEIFRQKELDKYYSEISELIYSNRTILSSFDKNLFCKVKISLASDGSILNLTISRTSGNSAYDAMAKTAILKSAPFELPKDQILNKKLRELEIGFKNNEEYNA